MLVGLVGLWLWSCEFMYEMWRQASGGASYEYDSLCNIECGRLWVDVSTGRRSPALLWLLLSCSGGDVILLAACPHLLGVKLHNWCRGLRWRCQIGLSGVHLPKRPASPIASRGLLSLLSSFSRHSLHKLLDRAINTASYHHVIVQHIRT